MTKNPLAWAFTDLPLSTDERELTLYQRTLAFRIVTRTVLVVVVGLITAGRGPRDAVMFAAMILGLVAVMQLFAGGRVPMFRYAGYLLAIVASYLLATHMHRRSHLTLILGGFTMIVLLSHLGDFVRFQREYASAGRGDAKLDTKFPLAGVILSVVVLIAFVGASLLVPMFYSNAAALVSVASISVFVWITAMLYSRSTLWSDMRACLLVFTGFPDSSQEHYYRPLLSQRQRMAAYGQVWGSLCLLICVALSFGLPWEPFAAKFTAGFKPPGPEYFADLAWLVEPPGRALFADAGYWLVFPCGFLVLLILPTLMLTAMLLPVLCQIRRATSVSSEQLSDAQEFARMTGRLHKSHEVCEES